MLDRDDIVSTMFEAILEGPTADEEEARRIWEAGIMRVCHLLLDRLGERP